MESLRRMIQQIAERYRLLDISQKVAIGLCVIVIAGSLWSLVQWSTEPNLVPIMAKDFTFDQMDTAEDALRGANIKFEQSGRRLLVHEKDKYNAIRVLNKNSALPEDFEFGFAKLMEEDSTFKPSSVLEHQRKVALGYELAKVIASSPAVEHAFVIVQQQNKRTIGQQHARPSASVKLTMKPGRSVTPTVVEGCANLVATAVAGLNPHDVTVFDARTLKSHKVPSPDELFDTGLLTERKRNEQHFRANILEQLSYVRGVLVSVSVELDGSRRRTESLAYGEAEVKSEETKTSKSGSSPVPGEPGVNPNTGVALSGGGGAVQSETEEGRLENYEPKVTERVVSEEPPFGVKRATAAINIPRSYIVSVVQARNPDLEEVHDTDRAFINARDEEFAGVRASVMNIIPARDSSDVQVDMFYDVGPGVGPGGGVFPGGPGDEIAAVAAVGTTRKLKSYAPQFGLAGLALFSLVAMMMMVRKTTRTTRAAFPMPKEEETGQYAVAPDGVLTVPGGPVGRAEASEGFLVGHEVDERTLQNKQLDEQVARLVDDDPAGVADLLRRWVEQEE